MATKTFKIGLSATDKQNMAQDIYEQVEQLLFAEYDSSETYNTGDFVVYSDVLYRCKEDNVTGTWNSAKWEQATLQDLVDSVNGAVASVTGKADIEALENGTLVVAHAQVADGVETNVGKLDKTPFAFESSGGQTDITTGYQRTLKLVGAKVVNNQWVQNGNFADGSNWSRNASYTQISSSVANNKLTISVTEAFTGVYACYQQDFSSKTIAGHKYLFTCYKKATKVRNGYPSISMFGATTNSYNNYSTANAKQFMWCIATATQTGNNLLQIFPFGDSENGTSDSAEFEDVRAIDLYQYFGSADVCNAILSLDSDKTDIENLMIFLGGKLPTDYDTGTFSTTKSKYVKSVKFNQWDEQWELGDISTDNGNKQSGNYVIPKNYIRVLPNTTYYWKSPYGGIRYFYDFNYNFLGFEYGSANSTFTTPVNACYMKFREPTNYGTTYNHDICINLHWNGERDGEYEQYEEVIEELPNVELNGILKVDGSGNIYADGDELYPDGEGNATRYGSVDLGTLSWTYDSTRQCFYASYTTNLAFTSGAELNNAQCGRYLQATAYQFDVTSLDKSFSINNSRISSQQRIWIRDTSYNNADTFKTAMSGVYLIYELTTPTTLSASQFTPNLFADDFGTLQFLDENSAEVNGLQGCEIFYKANVAGFAESVGINAEWKPENVLYKGDKTELSAKDTQLLNAIGGTLRQCLCVKESLDFDNTAFVDLGSPNWSYSTTRQCFSATISGSKGAVGGSMAKALSTKYRTVIGNTAYNGYVGGNDKCFGIFDNGECYLIDSSYTDTTTLKNSLKGVLLAYEKA